nr:ATP-binding protein [Endozoicomonas sp.]
MRRIALCFIVPFFLIILKASSDESAQHSDAPQVTLLRGYLASSRFFDRLSAQHSGYESEDMVGGSVRRAREETAKQFAWVLREYPLYNVLPTSALYVAVSGLSAKWAAKNLLWLAGQAMVNREKVVFWSILSLPVLVVGGGMFFGSLPSLYRGFYYSLFPPMLPEVNLVTAYGSKKALLPKSTQSYIEDELFYNFWQRPSSDGFKRLQKILDKALRLPFYRKSLTYNSDSIEGSLKYFSPNLVERLDRFVYSEIAYQKMAAQVSESHYPVYFQGAPGTGKTYAAQKLAEAMDTNLAVVTLDGSSVDDIVGTSFEREDSKPGLLVDAIVASTKSSRDINHKNQILLIDEFDRLFISGDQRNKEIL